MTACAERSREETHLLNPAFCCLGLTAAASGYQSVASHGIPIGLAYMVLPLTLHKATRESLPRDTRTSLPMWIQNNASARILFYERLVSLKPFTREAILFGCQRGWIVARDDASIMAGRTESSLRRSYQSLKPEPKECTIKSFFVGKWMAAAGSPATVMALWGIRP